MITNDNHNIVNTTEYKHRQTTKYFICVTQQGILSFISKGWGPKNIITGNCGFLDGDATLAIRGCDAADSVGLFSAELRVLAISKGRKQVGSVDLESTGQISVDKSTNL